MITLINDPTVDRLTTGVKTKFDEAMKSLAELPQTWQQVATEIQSDGEGELLNWLLDLTPMREWIGDKVVDGLRERRYYVLNRDYEKTIGVDRNVISDRKFGAAINVGDRLARVAVKNDDLLTFDTLVSASGAGPTAYDELSLFNAAHLTDAEDSATTTYSNVTSGAGQPWYVMDMRHGVGPLILQRRTPYEFVSLTARTDAPNFNSRQLLYSVEARLAVAAGLPQVVHKSSDTLNAANFDTVSQAMGNLIGADGKNLGIVPTHILVGRSNYRTARILFATDVMAGAALSATEAADKGLVEIVYSPRLP